MFPPSAHADYTIFSGCAIRLLKRPIPNELLKHKDHICRQLQKKAPTVLPGGKASAITNWKQLASSEANILRQQNSEFSIALYWLHYSKPNEPYVHSGLEVHSWLKRLSKINTAEAADAYWAISRGLHIIDEKHVANRQPSETPNYFKDKDKHLVIQELKRIMKAGHLVKYEELKRLLPTLPDVPERLGLGFVVKVKGIDETTGEVKLKLRLIIDASRPGPPQRSINSLISDFSTVLPTVDTIAPHMNPHHWACLADVGDAFHNLPTNPKSWSHLGIRININDEETDLCYTRLCFGIRHAVRAFQALAELIVLMLKDQSIIEKYDHLIVFVMAYIDDYCAVTKTKQGGHLFLASWKNLMRELGLPWDPAKIETPAKRITLLGIIVSMTDMTFTASAKRIKDTSEILMKQNEHTHFTLKELQRVNGKLQFIAKVIRFLKLFLRGLVQLIKKINATARAKGLETAGGERIQISQRVLNDRAIIIELFHAFNGCDVTAPARYPPANCSAAQSDASFWGCGYFVQGIHASYIWQNEGLIVFTSKENEAAGNAIVSTAYVECLGLLYMLRDNAPYWAGKYVHLHLDNDSLVQMIRGEKTKSEQVLPILIKCLAIIVAYNIKPNVSYISTHDMIFADPLSRIAIPKQKNPSKPDGAKYKKLAKTRIHSWKRNHPTWTRPTPANPSCPQALKLMFTWDDKIERSFIPNGDLRHLFPTTAKQIAL